MIRRQLSLTKGWLVTNRWKMSGTLTESGQHPWVCPTSVIILILSPQSEGIATKGIISGSQVHYKYEGKSFVMPPNWTFSIINDFHIVSTVSTVNICREWHFAINSLYSPTWQSDTVTKRANERDKFEGHKELQFGNKDYLYHEQDCENMQRALDTCRVLGGLAFMEVLQFGITAV